MSDADPAVQLSIINIDLLCTTSDLFMMPGDEIADVINAVLPTILETLAAHSGVLESVSNCRMLAVFSGMEDHALKAVQCASRLHSDIRTLTETRVGAGKRPVKLRIGIATGQAQRQTYNHPNYSGASHIGEPLAQAEALAAVAHPGNTILSGNTYSNIHDEISCRLVKQVRLHDYEESIKVYEILSDEAAELAESQKDNRRKYPRLELNLPVTLQVAQWSHRAEAINISAGGILVACKDSFQANTPVKLSAVLPLGKKELPLRIEGLIVHSTPKGDGRHAMGIKFKRLISEDREALEHLLSMILGEVLKNEAMHIDTGEDAAGVRFYAYEASALLDDIDL
jgi:class 3 adenylate cyclase